MKPWKVLEQAGLFSPLDVELTESLARVSSEASTQALLSVALVSHEVQAGHVCLEIARWAGREVPTSEHGTSTLRMPEYDAWLDELQRSPLVSRDPGQGPKRPLILDGEGRLYLARYYDHEIKLAKRLCHFAQATPAQASPELAGLDALFPPQPDGQEDRQREAVIASRERRLSVIVGGPGTGKTSTVVRLLAVLVQDALRSLAPAPRILLAAPTGKAAQRLGEAIELARERLPVDAQVKAAIPGTASTVHRALGSIPGSATRFRHSREQPLECDILLLDEASMVDLALMRRLLDAVPDHARVILLGDPDQLVSVEAGGVLIDLCKSADDAQSPLFGCKSTLTRSYRYPAHSGIAALATAVHAQDYDAVLDVLKSNLSDVRFGPSPEEGGLPRSLESEAKQGYRGLSESSLEKKLSALDTFRVLCAHRSGPGGVEDLSPKLARCVSGRARRPEDNYAGRPVLITQNDYVSRLFNGDVGVLHRGDGAPLQAHFRVNPLTVRSLSLARLPRHESVYAMTVHKSQGSEFERVAIVLPEKPSPILSRELLYTAITRAKLGVSVYGSEASIRAAVMQRTERASGLLSRLSR